MGVIDASVYVAMLFQDEIGHSESREWFFTVQQTGETIYAPGILLMEVAAALSRGKLNEELALEAVHDLQQGGLVELIPVSIDLCQKAAIISAKHKVRGCDAIYVALAEHLQTELVTLDKQQLERGAAVVSTRRPRDIS